ncbi:MAG: hypothetical protein NTZ05_22060, partial [Chloroflexi bacterium]|nr:hypothetical protein [Chloroflexota bacterium]
MTLFARDRGGLIYGRTFQNGDWTTNWQLWGGPKSVALAAPDGAASATATADGQGFYVAATFNDAAVWLRENRAGHSADWQSLGSPSGGAKG